MKPDLRTTHEVKRSRKRSLGKPQALQAERDTLLKEKSGLLQVRQAAPPRGAAIPLAQAADGKRLSALGLSGRLPQGKK